MTGGENSGSRQGPRRRPGAAGCPRSDPRDRTSAAFHVAGVVVRTIPTELDGIAREIAAIQGARVHASSAEGKLVVTLEGAATDAIVSGLESIRRLRGVVDAALVYQHGDGDEGDRSGKSEGGSE